jgi:hypothetical protein
MENLVIPKLIFANEIKEAYEKLKSASFSIS